MASKRKSLKVTKITIDEKVEKKTNTYESLAKKICNVLYTKNEYRTKMFRMPIEQLDNVRLDMCELRCVSSIKHLELYLLVSFDYINSHMVTVEQFLLHHEPNDDTLEEQINEKIIEYLNKLKIYKFNKLTNKFRIDSCDNSCDNKESELLKCFCETVEPNNIQLKSGKCCVCFDFTSNKTSCSHNLCVVCYQKLKKLKKSNKNTICCPMCRTQTKLDIDQDCECGCCEDEDDEEDEEEENEEDDEN